MGKIRIKTLGDEEQEKKDSKKAQAKAQEKGATLAPADLEAVKAKAERDLRFTLSKDKFFFV